MGITFGQVKSWKAAPLGTAGDGIKADLSKLEKSRDSLESKGVPGSWKGISAEAARAHRNGLVQQLTAHIANKQQMQKALYSAETEVEAIERLADAITERAAAQQFTVGDDGAVTDVSPTQTFDSQAEADDFTSRRKTIAEELAHDVSDLLTRAASVDATLTGTMSSSGNIEDSGDPHEDSAEDGYLDPEIAARWDDLSDDERRAVVEQMTEEIAEANGIDAPNIDWEEFADDTPEGGITYGSWDDDDNPLNPFDGSEMNLNPNVLDDPTQIIDTVAHELRHGRQYEAIRDENDSFNWWWQDDPFDEHEDDGITRDQANEWEENFDDYKSTSKGDTYEDYYDQPVEVDARRAGRDYVNGLTPEEFERMLEESR
ncbi:hypothetical protein FB381_1580 [Nocardioides albertanoniae]|uniref:Uncharacterized protein n=1 Tax=Nocardioides albertanoniae TaxID=1175486 RepID=A0A543A565_9ACTN|nr:hypothetical protein [Nocardioides albertanoniae]TQL67698.1 hypothetical protein FB381_1580 [Nocardioides albertanoniae]